MRRRLLLGVGFFAALLCGAYLYLLWKQTYTPGVTPDNFRRLHEGMSRAEVEAIMGGPSQTSYPLIKLYGRPLTHMEIWRGERCTIYLRFHDDRKYTVVECGCLDTGNGATTLIAEYPPNKDFFDWLRQRVGR
jgi:hypothetical protein